VVVGSPVEAPHPVRVAGAAGEDDHGRVGVDPRREPIGCPHAAEERQAAAVVEREVEHHERGLAHLDRAQRLPGAAGPGDPEAVRGQVVEQERARGLVVLDHQDQGLLVHTRRKHCAGESRPPPAARGTWPLVADGVAKPVSLRG
jgi:hypothetical protein